MKKKLPDTNHSMKTYRDEALKNQKKAKEMLEAMNLMLPADYQVKITDDFWRTLAFLEESASKFRDDNWSKGD